MKGSGLLLPAFACVNGRGRDRWRAAAAVVRQALACLAASAGVGGTGCWLLLPALVALHGHKRWKVAAAGPRCNRRTWAGPAAARAGPGRPLAFWLVGQNIYI